MPDMTPAMMTAVPAQRSMTERKMEHIAALRTRTRVPRTTSHSAKSAEASGEPVTTETTKPDEAAPETKTSPASPAIVQDPIVDLLSRLQVAAASLGERDTGLAMGIDKLVQQSAAPEATGQALFRTQVAYSLQDTEKALGRVEVPSPLRKEMAQLADTTPGLDNKSMQALLASTAQIDDRALVRDLRRGSASLATMGARQNIPEVGEVVEQFENRVRLAPRVATRTEPMAAAPVAASTEAFVERPAARVEPAARTAAVALDQSGGVREEARMAASPGDTSQRAKPSAIVNTASDSVAAIAEVTDHKPKTAISQIMSNLRPASSTSPPPWSAPPLRMAERLAAFQQRIDEGKTDNLIRTSENSGVAMMKSIETFTKGPGAAVLGKIDAAAKTEPGGAKAVMQEMQPGGRYAALRTEFDNALQSDRVFAAAYSQVEKTGAQYGKDRMALNADFDAKKLDPSRLDARFQQADEAIGEAAERIPGRTPGKSAMDELGQRVAEMIGRAVQKVRTMFGRDAAPDPQPSASPSMAP